MNYFDNYNDLCTDIDVQQYLVDSIEKELLQLKKLLATGPRDITGIDYSRESGGQAIYISMDRLLDRIHRIEERLIVEKNILEQKEKTKKNIEEIIFGMEGLNAKVVRMRDIEGKDLKKISESLGYSYQYIKEVSARNKPTFTIHTREK